VFNKLDLAVGSEEELKGLTTIPFLEGQSALSSKDIVVISAAKGWGINRLLEKISGHFSTTLRQGMMAKTE
jgi:50S ribosomal subunit-associated GTPase HflX